MSNCEKMKKATIDAMAAGWAALAKMRKERRYNSSEMQEEIKITKGIFDKEKILNWLTMGILGINLAMLVVGIVGLSGAYVRWQSYIAQFPGKAQFLISTEYVINEKLTDPQKALAKIIAEIPPRMLLGGKEEVRFNYDRGRNVYSLVNTSDNSIVDFKLDVFIETFGLHVGFFYYGKPTNLIEAGINEMREKSVKIELLNASFEPIGQVKKYKITQLIKELDSKKIMDQNIGYGYWLDIGNELLDRIKKEYSVAGAKYCRLDFS